MPTYQYACTESACGHRFETVQSFSDDPLTMCPVCEGQVRKVFSSVGVVFKGSGFYRTDSRAAERSSNGKDGGPAKKSESSSASSSSSSSGSSSSSSTGSSSTASGSSSGSTSKAAAS